MKPLVIYMPAIHSGYLKLIDSAKVTDVYLLDNNLVVDLIPRLERDVRALNANEVAPMLQTYFKKVRVNVLNKTRLSSLPRNKTIILPNEDVSRKFAENYLRNFKIKYVNVFLRWDMKAVNKIAKPATKYRITAKDFDRRIMAKSVSFAKKSPDWWRQVSALAVKDKQIILSSYNQSYPNKNYTAEIFGDPRSNFDAGQKLELSKVIHAEAAIISQAAKKGIALQGTSLYVSTFPCPVCAKLIANAGIKEIYFKDGYSLLDAEDIFKAKKIKLIRVS